MCCFVLHSTSMLTFRFCLLKTLLFVCCFNNATLDTVDARHTRKSSDEDIKIDKLLQDLHDICHPYETIQELQKKLEVSLDNIKVYKDVVKLNKQWRKEINWIIAESKGQKEAMRIIGLLKKDMQEMCAAPKKKYGKYKDCTDLMKKSKTQMKSGVFKIYPDETKSVQVYCDMTTDSGGWTVIQRRMDGSVNFQRKWKECENGFGNITREYWFGNKFIHKLTSSGKYELRIDMVDTKKKKKIAVYKTFIIGDAASKYKLTIGYSGNAGDVFKNNNGMKFTTIDQDNDILKKDNCAKLNNGSWWYTQCVGSDLNQWKPYWQNYWAIYSTMMIRQL